MSNIDEVLDELEKKMAQIKGRSGKISVDDCYLILNIQNYSETYEVEFNLMTLGSNSNNRLPDNLQRELRTTIKDRYMIAWKYRKENHVFFDYLKFALKDDYKKAVFIKQESPDFILYCDQKKLAFEVSEAIDLHNAQFDKILYNNAGRGRTIVDYESYISSKHKSKINKYSIEEFGDNIILSPSHGMVDTGELRKIIVNAIENKIKKYKKYICDFDEKNIIIFFNDLGYDNFSDYEEVGKLIANNKIIYLSDINRIYVLSGMYEVFVEYDKTGKFKVWKG